MIRLAKSHAKRETSLTLEFSCEKCRLWKGHSSVCHKASPELRLGDRLALYVRQTIKKSQLHSTLWKTLMMLWPKLDILMLEFLCQKCWLWTGCSSFFIYAFLLWVKNDSWICNTAITQDKTFLGTGEILKLWGICDERSWWKCWVSILASGGLSKASGCTLSLSIPANNRRPATTLALPLMCCEVRQSGGVCWAV
jgi:hypothetical protein